MPDLIHYVQAICREVGLQIGHKKAQALKKLQSCKESNTETLQHNFDFINQQI